MKRNKWLLGIPVILAILLAALLVIQPMKSSQTNLEGSAQAVTATEVKTEDEKPEKPEKKEKPKKPYVSPIDFKSLWKTNEDIYAWIKIDGTDMEFPVVQHPTDSDYYLTHTVEHDEGYPGSIYSRCDNRTDLSGFNTIIYGHNMYNGTMFSDLTNYRDPDYFKKHRKIRLYTPNGEYIYKVFAAVVYDDRLISDAFNDISLSDRELFLESIYDIRDMNSQIADDIEVTANSRILTLSTCIQYMPDNRFLVEAVLTRVKD